MHEAYSHINGLDSCALQQNELWSRVAGGTNDGVSLFKTTEKSGICPNGLGSSKKVIICATSFASQLLQFNSNNGKYRTGHKKRKGLCSHRYFNMVRKMWSALYTCIS